MKARYAYLICIIIVGAILTTCSTANANDRIRPYSDNPFYWQYKGQPVLLLGGSWQDNLFNHPTGLERHLDLLKYQTAFVVKLLSYSLKYPHVLYCMNNETGEHVAWGDYWADHVRQRAAQAGVEVHTTDMRRNETIRAEDHHHTFDQSERYTFLDISQNNAWEGLGQKHYDNILYVRDYIAEKPRPINNIKNYGAARHGEEESVARFCRIVFAGCAGVRFHRPHPLETPDAHEAATEFGLGLSPRVQAVIASMRQVADAIDIFRTEPRNDLLTDREENEAYCLAKAGKQYAVYFSDGGEVSLDVSDSVSSLTLRWLDISNSAWLEPETIAAGENLQLKAPGSGHWAVLVLAAKYKSVSRD